MQSLRLRCEQRVPLGSEGLQRGEVADGFDGQHGLPELVQRSRPGPVRPAAASAGPARRRRQAAEMAPCRPSGVLVRSVSRRGGRARRKLAALELEGGHPDQPLEGALGAHVVRPLGERRRHRARGEDRAAAPRAARLGRKTAIGALARATAEVMCSRMRGADSASSQSGWSGGEALQTSRSSPPSDRSSSARRSVRKSRSAPSPCRQTSRPGAPASRRRAPRPARGCADRLPSRSRPAAPVPPRRRRRDHGWLPAPARSGPAARAGPGRSGRSSSRVTGDTSRLIEGLQVGAAEQRVAGVPARPRG